MSHEETFDHAASVPAVTPTIPADLRRAAALTVAHNATSVPDCARLLDQLGLTPQDGLDRKARK